jgi:Beta-galactosidase
MKQETDMDSAEPNRMVRRAAAGAGAAGLLLAASELRVGKALRPLTDDWRQVAVEPRRSTMLGISFRTLQAEAFDLDPAATLSTLLGHPFELIRLGAYWNRIEPGPGRFEPDELDRQIEAVERAGKKIIVCAGAVKTFGYPEFFVPAHHLAEPLPEGTLVTPDTHRSLLGAATAFLTRIVDRYKDHDAVVGWQVEHEAVDPLGMEHSWRLSDGFVRAEVEAVREADPTRPVHLNGFLPTSLPVALQQWWRTRDQGDSLSVARDLADVVGIDFYPRHALAGLAGRTLYLAGGRSPWLQGRRRRLFDWAGSPGRQVMISEGQAEPWETVTTPPDPSAHAMYSCPPEALIGNYNQCVRWGRDARSDLYAYLFWGAEYWVLRHQGGDPRYLDAFARVLDQA